MKPPRFLKNAAEHVFRQDRKAMDALFWTSVGAVAVSTCIILPWGMYTVYGPKQNNSNPETSTQPPQPTR